MMDVTPLIPKGRKLIRAYGDGGFTINEEKYSGSVIVFPDTVTPWPIARFEESTDIGLFRDILNRSDVEILLIGCGKRLQFLPRDIERALRASGIVADAMDTGAACRTYNVLLSEERAVAAALIAV